MERVKSLLKIIGPFLIVAFFMLLANTLQVIPFALLKKLNDDQFGLINYGLYVITFLSVVMGAFERWLLISLSKLPSQERLSAVKGIFTKTVNPVVVLFILLGILWGIVYLPALPLVIFGTVSIIVVFLSLFPRVLVVSEENYVLLGIVSLIEPIFRLIFVYLFVQNGQLLPFFIGHLISSFTVFVISYVFYRKTVSGKGHKIEKNGKFITNLQLREIIGQVLLQLAINIFWIADGLILKNILDSVTYGAYVTYAYIVKFPLFITLSFVNVLTIKNIVEEGQKREFRNMMIIAIFLSIIVFSIVGLFDTVFPGYILGFLGFSRYFQAGLLFIISFAWLIHTILNIMFIYLLKIEVGPRLIINIGSYALSFLVVLLVFHQSLLTLIAAIIMQGGLFVFVVFFTQKEFLRQSP